MANSNFFATPGVRRVVHTPFTFRSRRRLAFPFSTPPSIPSSQPPAPATTAAPDDSSIPPIPGVDVSSAPPPDPQPPLQYVLPWETASKATSLYKISPPKLRYPAGSRDEDVNKRFLRQMDMFLFSNFQVRQVLEGTRQHPFENCSRLVEYYAANGTPNFVFDKTKTFTILQAIASAGHSDFHREMHELLWFGGVESYGNIMCKTYAIIYGWIDEDDFQDVDGLCEDDDGVTFRRVIQKSLRTVRVKHVQEIVNRLYTKLDTAYLVMRPNGMSGYFAQLNKIRKTMAKHGELVSDKYLLRRTELAISSKHEKLSKALTDLRFAAGKSGIPTTYATAQDFLTDVFDFEIPDKDKNDKSRKLVGANLANDPDSKLTGKRKPDNDRGADGGDRNKNRSPYKRPKFPKGSCKNCPESTRHTTQYCWKTIRKRMGLPNGYQWCTRHKFGCHYDHLCKRHAPNYPPAPKIVAAVAKPKVDTPAEIRDRLANMFGIQQSPSSHAANVADASVPPASPDVPQAIKITPPSTNKQNFQTARVVSTNSASTGPPVDSIFQKILAMSETDRQTLVQQLSSAGF